MASAGTPSVPMAFLSLGDQWVSKCPPPAWSVKADLKIWLCSWYRYIWPLWWSRTVKQFLFNWNCRSLLSASWARPSRNLFLSSLIFFLTALWASLYFSCATVLPAWMQLLFSTLSFSFLCTFSNVSWEIHSRCCNFLLPNRFSQALIQVSFESCHWSCRSVLSSSKSSGVLGTYSKEIGGTYPKPLCPSKSPHCNEVLYSELPRPSSASSLS